MKIRALIIVALVIAATAAIVNLNPTLSEAKAQSSILAKQWNYGLAPRYWWGYFGSSPALTDLGPDVNKKGSEPDSSLEIVIGCDGYHFNSTEIGYVDGLWRCLDSQGNCEWATDTKSDEARSSPAIADLDYDGYLEIAAGTTSGETLEIMDRFGEFEWTFPRPPRPGNFYYPGSPAVAILNPFIEGLEVVIGNRPYGNVLCFDGDNSDGIDEGTSAAGIPGSPYAGVEGKDWDLLWIFNGSGKIWASPAISDVDMDGILEVIIGSTDGKLFILNGLNGILETSIDIGSPIYASAALANLDIDPYLEIVVGSTDNKIYCFQWNGKTAETEWVYQTEGAVYSSASLGDVNWDGSPEIVVGSKDGNIYCLSSSGNLEWKYATGGAIYSSPALAYRGTKSLGIYIGSTDAYLYLISGTGSLIDKFLTYGEIRTSPAVSDIDGDEKLEVVFYDWSSYDTLWCLEDTGSNVPKYTIEWQMFRHDKLRTGLYWPLIPSIVNKLRSGHAELEEQGQVGHHLHGAS